MFHYTQSHETQNRKVGHCTTTTAFSIYFLHKERSEQAYQYRHLFVVYF